MSTDSSRHATVRSGDPNHKRGESTTMPQIGNGDVVVRPSGQSNDVSVRRSVPVMTIQPGSGRPHVARLPIVEKEIYQIEGEVAQGGIGRVLSARDERLDRRVAVKVLLEESGAYEDRFVREALVTARLQHPSIVPVYEAGRWPSGEPFYSMKLVSGKPLLDVIEESRTLDERLPLLTRVLAVADAMAYAHERRIIHRDLKPANILIGSHGETVLIDWGLAKDLNELNVPSAAELGVDLNAPAPENNTLTMVGSVMGTPSYMPPEQAAGDSVDERADVYALGAILYHVLSGKQPYAGYNGMQTIMRVLEEPPEALVALQSGIPRDLLTIIDKAMHRERAERYPTAKEFAEDLRRFLTGQLVGAHHYSSRERLLRFVRKHRTAFGVGAVAIAIMIMSGAIFVTRIIQERDRAEAERKRAELARHQSIAAEAEATKRADELTLVEARAAVERDPNAALAWLKALSPSFEKWNAARLIAADAWSRGTSRTIRNHHEVINAMVLFDNEKNLVTASDDHTVRIANLENGQTRIWAGHEDEVWSIGISSDGKKIATGSKDRTIRIWDLATGQTKTVLRGHLGGIVYTLFSKDDKFIFSQSDDCTLRVWDLTTGKDRILASGSTVSLKSIVSPDERNFVSAGVDGSVWHVRLDGENPKQIDGLAVTTGVPLVAGKYPMKYSPDGRYVLVGGPDGLVREWDFQKEKLRVFEGQTAPIVRVAYSPDGSRIAAASSDGSMRLWDIATGTSRVLPAQEANVSVLVFSPDGQMVAAAGYDKSARIIDLATGARRRFVGMQDSVDLAMFTKDSRSLIVASSEGAVRIFQVRAESGRLLGKHEGAAISLAVSPLGDFIASGGNDGMVRLWPTNESDSAVATFSGHFGGIPILKISPNGELILSSGFDGTVRLWDRYGHQIRSLYLPGTGTVPAKIAFSPNGGRIAIGNSDGLLQLWDVDSGELREIGHHGGNIVFVSFAPDGRRLGSAGADKVAKVWDLETNSSTDLAGHEAAVDWISFSPDGKTIATGSLDHRLRFWDSGSTASRVYDASGYIVLGLSFLPDSTSMLSYSGNSSARLWDVSTGNVLQIFRGHRGNITSLVLASNGEAFATSSDDRTVRMYDIGTGESRVVGVHDAAVRAVGIDPRGQWVASAGDDGAVRMWMDDLPRDSQALRSWIEKSVTDVIDVHALGEGSVPLP